MKNVFKSGEWIMADNQFAPNRICCANNQEKALRFNDVKYQEGMSILTYPLDILKRLV